MERTGCPQTYSCTAGAPCGGSYHFLPLLEHERITPPHLTFISFISDPLEAQRQGVIPFPHFYAGKVPLWASLDTATLGGWGRRVPPPGRKLHCADHKPTPGCWEQDAR